jgi:hypothetical protein
MTDQTRMMRLETEMAAPLHLQRLERSLNIQPFLSQVNELFREQIRYSIFNLSFLCLLYLPSCLSLLYNLLQ